MNFVWHDDYSDQIRIASGARSQDYAARSLVATTDSGLIAIRLRNSTDNVLAADWTQFGDQNGNGFLSSDALVVYLNGEFAKKRAVGGVVSLTAGMDLGGHKALMFADDGSAVYADPTSSDYVFAGVSLQAGMAGAQVQAMTDGLIIEPSWAWVPLEPVYVGGAGVLTQTPPTSGFWHMIGSAASATSLMVDPSPLVVLA